MFRTKHPAYMDSPVLTLRHLDNAHLLGYKELVLVAATSFNQRTSGIGCIEGEKDARFGKTMPIGAYRVDYTGPSLFYAVPHRGEPVAVGLKYKAGNNFMVSMPSGYQLLVEHAEQIHIRPVAPGYAGMPIEVTTSKPWLFGKAAFGFSGLEF